MCNLIMCFFFYFYSLYLNIKTDILINTKLCVQHKCAKLLIISIYFRVRRQPK